MTLYALIALVFLATASLLFFLFYIIFLPKKSIIKGRLESLRPYTEEQVFLERPLSPWQKFLGRLGKNIPLRPQEHGKYTRMLIAAGIRTERFPIFMGSKILLAMLLPAIYLLLYGIPIEKDFTVRALLVFVFAIVGFILPSVWLLRKVKQRQLKIFHDLPDLLDLMTVCVEAGLSMDAAMVKVYEDEQFRRSPLSGEMRVAIQETRAGKPRLEALRDMGERSMVDDLKSFAAMLVQTERLGTSLAQSLRVFSDSLRTIRIQRAEEAAAKTTIKLVFPLVFLILPSLFIVMLLPAIIRISRVISKI